MPLGDRVAEMTDKQLENLHANATRLAQTGNVRQKLEAEALLPVVDAVIEERRGQRLALAEEKKAAAKKARSVASRKT